MNDIRLSILSVLILISFSFACTTDNKDSTDEIVNYMLEQNVESVSNIEDWVKSRGNSKKDSTLHHEIISFHKEISHIFEALDKKSFQEISEEISHMLSSNVLSKNLSSEIDKPKEMVYESLRKKDINNLKLSLALLESEVIDSKAGMIGATDIYFKSASLIFVPDIYYKKQGETLKGKLLLGAFAGNIKDSTTIKLNGNEFRVIDNGAPVEIHKSGNMSAEIKVTDNPIEGSFKVVEID